MDGTCTPSGEYESKNKPNGTVCGYGAWEDDPANDCKERREILKCVDGTCTPSGEYESKNKIIPDLVITEKHETLVGDSFTVTYTVTNVGGGGAGASNTTIYIDGVNVMEDPVSALAAGANYSNTVGPFDCPCGTILNVTVCADNGNAIAECNETNNCLENVFDCLPCSTNVAIYNFANLSSAGVDKWAYRYQIDPKSPIQEDDPIIEFTGIDRKGEYTMISGNDHKLQKDSTDTLEYYAAHRFVFNINESVVDSIVEIDVQWTGKGVTRAKGLLHGATLYIWNATTSSEYEPLAETFSRGRETLTGVINETANPENYVDATGNLTILVVQNANQMETLKGRALASMLSTDYVQADVTYYG